MHFFRNQLGRIDGTAIVVFCELMRLRKTTAVAAQVNLSQSAVSHVLRRLRETFDDDLFTRSPGGMVPTARAFQIEPQLRTALAALQAAAGEPDFEPAEARGRLRIVGSDCEMMPEIVVRLGRIVAAAPRVSVSFANMDAATALESLAAGSVDLVVGFVGATSGALTARDIHTHEFRVVGVRPELAGGGAIGLQDYVELPHLITTAGLDLRTVIDQRLASCGLQRDVRYRLPARREVFLPLLLQGMVATVPASLAASLAEEADLFQCQLPELLRRLPLQVVTHTDAGRNRLTAWAGDMFFIDRAANDPSPRLIAVGG